MKSLYFLPVSFLFFFFSSCNTKTPQENEAPTSKIKVIFDTDANNELDDQHALAYLLMNGQDFEVAAVTVNATYNGGNIEEQHKEAQRIMQLLNLEDKIPLLKGADKDFNDIKDDLSSSSFDGSEAVNFIVDEAEKTENQKLILLAVGKLTNVSLALEKNPEIAQKVKVVWLGSNYPKPGEYNQDNDTTAMNYLLNKDVEFELVTVRYGENSGTDAVRVSKTEINQKMPGKGPKANNTVIGRHGDAVGNFGDYSINLFEHIDLHGDPPSRALYDMAAVAIVKNKDWAESKTIPAPVLVNNQWVERPDNSRKIILWENFKKEEILEDFFKTMDDYVLVGEK